MEVLQTRAVGWVGVAATVGVDGGLNGVGEASGNVVEVAASVDCATARVTVDSMVAVGGGDDGIAVAETSAPDRSSPAN